MRWVCGPLSALFLAGCGGSVTLSTAPDSSGGGGGFVASPAPTCPVDFAQALREAVAGVPDRLTRHALATRAQVIHDVTGAASRTAREAAVTDFIGQVEIFEHQARVSPAQALRLRQLANCYLDTWR